MIDSLLLHPKTRNTVLYFLEHMPHAILLTGAEGSGKETLSRHLAASLLDVDVDSLDKQAYFFLINPAGDSISIDDIRNLRQFLKLKTVTSKKSTVSRVALIHNADRMRTEAQNALLKTLEEPPSGTTIILTANKSEALLPTIISRVSVLTVLPVGQVEAEEYFARNINKEYALSQGQVGLLHALLHDEAHPLIRYVQMAKEILAEKRSDRLLRTDGIAKDKNSVKLLLDALQRIAHAALFQASKEYKAMGVKNWHSRQKAITEANARLQYNANIKLLLDNLFLTI